MVRPSDQANFRILRENGASQATALNFIDGATPRAQWTIRSATGKQELFYRADILLTQNPDTEQIPAAPAIAPVSWTGALRLGGRGDFLKQAYATSPTALA